MKRIALFIITLFVCVVCYGATFNQYWYIEDNTPIQTSCTTGSDIILPTPPTKYGYDFIGWEQLPYVRIEYLESTGTQWIDTGFKPNQDTRVIMTYLKQSGNDDIGWLFGSRNSIGVSSFGVFYDNAPAVIQTDYNDQRNNITNRIYNKKLTVDKNKNVTEIIDFDTGDTLATNTSAERTFSSNYNLYLSALNNGGSVSLYKTKSIYSCKIYNNDTLVRDFIPVLDKNGTPCLYDKVEGKFYYNAGTGDFIAGPVIEE